MSKKSHAKDRHKVSKVLKEFKNGQLRSGSGSLVKSMDQAVAIAMNEAGVSKKRKGKK